MVSIVKIASVEQVLADLRREYDKVGSEVDRLQAKLETGRTRLGRLGDAIQKLELLDEDKGAEPDTMPDTSNTSKPPEVEPDVLSTLDDGDSNLPAVPADSPVAEYLRGEGRRLRSTAMVVDLLDEINDTVSRDEFKKAFFAKFPREDVELIWENAENAISTALLRATKENLIAKGRRNGRIDIYASKGLAARLHEERVQRIAASPNSGAEDDD